MKKIIFGLLATVMVAGSSFGQTNEEIKKVYIENRPVFAKLMSDFVNRLEHNYTEGMTYDSFVEKVATPKDLSSDGNVILNKAFTYLQNGTCEESIQKRESGYEIAQAFVNYSKSNTSVEFEDYLFGQSDSQAKGFWSSLWHGIKAAVSWIWEHAEEIFTNYIKCCDAHLCCH